MIADTVLLRQMIEHCSTDLEAVYRKRRHDSTNGPVLKQDLTLSNQDFLLVHHFSQQLETACVGREFFATTGGRISLAPGDVQERDVICVPYFGGPLFVLHFYRKAEKWRPRWLGMQMCAA